MIYIHIFFHVFIATFHTKIKYPGTLHEYIDFGKKTFKFCHCKTLFWLNKHLTHSTQSNPKFSLCCLSGKIKLPRPLPTSHLFYDLPNNIFGQKSKRSRANICAYNSMFACISMGANVD